MSATPSVATSSSMIVQSESGSEMHQGKRDTQWSFSMNTHIDVDAELGLGKAQRRYGRARIEDFKSSEKQSVVDSSDL